MELWLFYSAVVFLLARNFRCPVLAYTRGFHLVICYRLDEEHVAIKTHSLSYANENWITPKTTEPYEEYKEK
jgi:hypothetical protein